ncbi:MAG TPA: hypothetical protein VMX14_13415 [Anaerolineae bacterium]|nr:hypothetical protein [Anaerolineae bacterium]
MSKSNNRHQNQTPDRPDPDRLPSPLTTALIAGLILLIIAATVALRLLRFLR